MLSFVTRWFSLWKTGADGEGEGAEEEGDGVEGGSEGFKRAGEGTEVDRGEIIEELILVGKDG